MSSKSNIDNRANQLNPNNDAYYSSRGISRDYDSDDSDDENAEAMYSSHNRTFFAPRHLDPQPVSRKFALVYIGFSGHAQLVRVQLETNSSSEILRVRESLKAFANRMLKDGLLATVLELREPIAYVSLYEEADQSITWSIVDRPANGLLATAALIRIERYLLNPSDSMAGVELVVTNQREGIVPASAEIQGVATVFDVKVE